MDFIYKRIVVQPCAKNDYYEIVYARYLYFFQFEMYRRKDVQKILEDVRKQLKKQNINIAKKREGKFYDDVKAGVETAEKQCEQAIKDSQNGYSKINLEQDILRLNYGGVDLNKLKDAMNKALGPPPTEKEDRIQYSFQASLVKQALQYFFDSQDNIFQQIRQQKLPQPSITYRDKHAKVIDLSNLDKNSNYEFLISGFTTEKDNDYWKDFSKQQNPIPIMVQWESGDKMSILVNGFISFLKNQNPINLANITQSLWKSLKNFQNGDSLLQFFQRTGSYLIDLKKLCQNPYLILFQKAMSFIIHTIIEALKTFIQVHKRTKIVGELLNQDISENFQTKGTINLLGHSLGTVVIEHVMHNFEMGSYKLNKILLFAGVASLHTDWQALQEKTQASICNFYSHNDMVLKYFIENTGLIEDKDDQSIGINPILNCKGLCNIKSELGHTEYKDKMYEYSELAWFAAFYAQDNTPLTIEGIRTITEVHQQLI